jgi:hypothetical protein
MNKATSKQEGPKKFGVPEKKSSLFPYKRTAFFSGTPNFLGPSYFEAALLKNEHQLLKCNCTRMPDTSFSKRAFVQ